MISIYALFDPNTGRCRYIGQAKNPQSRFKRHLTDAVRYNRTHKERWIKSLLDKGQEPHLVILIKISADLSNESEKWWIKRAREIYTTEYMTNISLGGSVVNKSKYECTEETRDKLSAAGKRRVASEETRKKISIAQHDPIVMEKTLLANRGEANHQCKLTKEQVLEIRSLSTAGYSGKELSKTYGVGTTQISRIIRRTIWAWL